MIGNKKSFAKAVLVLIIIFSMGTVAGLTGYALSLKKAFQRSAQPEKPVKNPAVKPASSPNDENGKWKTYSNEEYGFEFEYPSDWFYKEAIPQPSNYGLKVIFSDYENKTVLVYNQPVPEIGYEAWTLTETRKMELFTKILFKAKSGSEDFGNLILAEWYGKKFENSGQFVLNYSYESDPRIKILDQIISTFKFIK